MRLSVYIRKPFQVSARILPYMSENYIGKSYHYFSDIPSEVINDEELVVVDKGFNQGYKISTADQSENTTE